MSAGQTDFSLPLPPERQEAMLARIERVLADMIHVLTLSGFSIYEAGQITLSTRFSIVSLVKERARKS